MLINFSNHPSAQWGAEQMEAARAYGEVEDVYFPVVAPEMSAAEVNKLADEYADMLLNLYGSSVTIHVMGEMTFTFMVITRLKELGIKCVASTTERKTTYNDDGTKVSEFQFVKFREY